MNRLLMICYIALMVLSFFLAKVDKDTSKTHVYMQESLSQTIEDQVAAADLTSEADTSSASFSTNIIMGNLKNLFKYTSLAHIK